jgi:hypothetical protein
MKQTFNITLQEHYSNISTEYKENLGSCLKKKKKTKETKRGQTKNNTDDSLIYTF